MFKKSLVAIMGTMQSPRFKTEIAVYQLQQFTKIRLSKGAQQCQTLMHGL